jgi:hypothetical protein
MSPLPACPAEVPAWIEHAFVDNGQSAWIEIEWIYRGALPAEVHAFVDEAVGHLTMRDLWLQDPRHASDLVHEVITADLFAYGEARAAAEDVALHDLIAAWVRGHDLTAVSS